MSDADQGVSKAGVVYILTNPAMEGLIKIGKCSNGRLRERVREMDRHEGVPLPFEVFYAAQVADRAFVERQMHEAFGHHRLRSTREFFRLDPVRAKAALRLAAIEEASIEGDTTEDPEGEEALKREIRRKRPLNMRAIGIIEGNELVHADDQNIKCVVRGPREVEFGGQRMSLSAAARAAAERMGRLTPSEAYQGGQYWLYEGETLVEIRRRVETQAAAGADGEDA